MVKAVQSRSKWVIIQYVHFIFLSTTLYHQVAQESLKKRQESEKNRQVNNVNGELPPQAPAAPRMTKAGGWLPSSDSSLHARQELEDPLLQQIENIQSFLRQAREARRLDEVAMLEENLRQLQDEYEHRFITHSC